MIYSIVLLVLALLPALLIVSNLKLFNRASLKSGAEQPAISVLIPARNEAAGIGQTLDCLLKSTYPSLEVVVLDDHSDDSTVEIVESVAEGDARLRLERSAPLPEGWNGKQHACWQLAGLAKHGFLLFMDADVHVTPEALDRLVAEQSIRQPALLSGFPRQIMGSFSEQLLIPMMHYILLGYLPLEQMRGSKKESFGAGCGQLFLCTREAYFKSGGHKAIRSSRHDGLKLPRAFRKAGFMTDLFDASDICEVRMYRGVRELTAGLLKNANEGIANRKLIGIFTALLLGGSVLPVLSFAHAVFYGWPSIDQNRLWATVVLGIATLVSFFGRFLIARQLGQSMLGVALHPLAVLWFVALQWYAFVSNALGRPQVAWRGRQSS